MREGSTIASVVARFCPRMCLKSRANLPETTRVSVRFIYGRNRRFWRGVGANERRSKMLKLSGTLKTFAKGTTLAVAIGAAGLAFSAAPVAAQMHRPSAGFHADRGDAQGREWRVHRALLFALRCERSFGNHRSGRHCPLTVRHWHRCRARKRVNLRWP